MCRGGPECLWDVSGCANLRQYLERWRDLGCRQPAIGHFGHCRTGLHHGKQLSSRRQNRPDVGELGHQRRIDMVVDRLDGDAAFVVKAVESLHHSEGNEK